MANKGDTLEKSKRKRLIFRVIALVALAYMLLQTFLVQMQINDNKKTIANLDIQLADQQDQNEEYEYLLQQGNNPDYMEERAREDKSLQMVYPGEQVFYDTTDE